MAQVMDVALIKIIKSKRHIKKQVHWYFYVHEFLYSVISVLYSVVYVVSYMYE
jgi:hypothetical protein